jgi:hypothetical protein
MIQEICSSFFPFAARDMIFRIEMKAKNCYLYEFLFGIIIAFGSEIDNYRTYPSAVQTILGNI